MAEDKFNIACEEIKKFIEKLKDEEKLAVYGLFKQATLGDNTTAKPGMFSPKEKAKWEAWTSRKGISAEESKIKYVETVKLYAEKYGKTEIALKL